MFDNGSIGAQTGAGVGSVLQGQSLSFLFDARLLVGTGPDRLSGAAYGSDDWMPLEPVTVLDSGNSQLQIKRAAFSDASAPNPLGVTVTQVSRSVGNMGALSGVVVLDYTIRNTTASPLDGVYAGLFADFDVDEFGDDQAQFYAPSNFLYTYDGTTTSPTAGIVLLGDEAVSGWSGNLGLGPFTDDLLFTAMTTAGPAPSPPGERVSVLGTGPYDIAPGDSVTVRFAFVAGVNSYEAFQSMYAGRRQYPPDPTGLSQTHDTGTAALRIFSNGHVGALSGTPGGTTFSFGGGSPLFEGQLLVSTGPNQIAGAPYAAALDGARLSRGIGRAARSRRRLPHPPRSRRRTRRPTPTPARPT